VPWHGSCALDRVIDPIELWQFEAELTAWQLYGVSTD